MLSILGKRNGFDPVSSKLEAVRPLPAPFRHYDRVLRGLVVLPQAFRIAMPATINHFVITIKETALVVIVGLFDLMASGNAAYQTGVWSAYHRDVYPFVALICFAGAFTLSRYGAYVERPFGAGR